MYIFGVAMLPRLQRELAKFLLGRRGEEQTLYASAEVLGVRIKCAHSQMVNKSMFRCRFSTARFSPAVD